MAAPSTRRRFRFGAFELDVDSGELRKQGVPLKLRPQASKVLLLLVGRAGELVTRDELRHALWGGDTHVEFDQAVNTCIRDVRAALLDEHTRPRYVATVPGCGYRFIAPVDSPPEARRTATYPRHLLWMACACILLFAVGAVWAYKSAGFGTHKGAQAGQFGVLNGGWPATSSVRNPEAYRLYLLGRRFLNRSSVEGVLNRDSAEGAKWAIEVFEQASTMDPGSALPVAGLADAYCELALRRELSPSATYLKAMLAARRALDLDPSSAEAHVATARIRMKYERDWAAADREHRRAIEINPNLADAHLSYGLQLMFQSRFQQAREETRRAQELDPLSARMGYQLCSISYSERNYDQAIAECRAAIELEPAYSSPRLLVAAAYTQKRLYTKAADVLSEFKKDSTERQGDVAGYLYAVSGRRADAVSALNSLKSRYRPHQVAALYMGLGNKDRALEWLEKAYADHGALASLRIDPVFEPLASDPRFQDLLRRVGLEN